MIKCDKHSCKHHFHVRCAIKEKLIVDWIKMDKRGMKVYCLDHEACMPNNTENYVERTKTDR